MNSVLVVGLIIMVGLALGETARMIRLPKITGYIVAGIVLNPRLTGWIPLDFVNHTEGVTNIALAFITFSVGGTLLISRLKRLGKEILTIALLEAELAFAAVIFGVFAASWLLGFTPAGNEFGMLLPLCILLGSTASPTDPTATLAVAHEYKAKGDVSASIMGIAAIDDALGIINYSIAIAVAGIFMGNSLSVESALIEPLLAVAGGIILGTAFGWILKSFVIMFQRETESAMIVLVFGMLAACFGVAEVLGLDELLSTMAMGIVVANFCRYQEQIFQMLERYTEELIFVLFFTISAMHLNFDALSGALGFVVLFVLFRAAGKFAGTSVGATLSGASGKVRRYTAFGLLPQGGIVIGLALMIRGKPEFAPIADTFIGIVIGATVIHELIGPVMAKLALSRSGEISARNSE
ncbi:MAG: cation:proton antiporter [Desulfobacteraceae bacterium]|nr:cation:proton antiporter [Desulfobacteraceae bacterium]